MSAEAEILQEKFTALLRWEKRKRWEQILLTVSCYALLAALAALPLNAIVPSALGRWWVPLLFFMALSPLIYFKERWRAQDALRVLARLDKSLGLAERAVTAWELLARNDKRATALLVFKEAGEKIKSLNPRALFGRSWSWQAYLVAPLFLAWFALLWFDVGVSVGDKIRRPTPLAHKLKEYSRELQEKAQSEGLRESLQLGRELEKIAQRGIDAQKAEEQFKKELAGVAKKLEAGSKSAAGEPSFSAAESQQSLKDLKAELEAARDLLNFPDGVKGSGEMEQKWLDRLAGLPQLKKQLERQNQGGRGLSQNELRAFLDSTEKQAGAELDRRTLLDAQQFLEQLMKQGQGEKGENNLRVAGRDDPGAPENLDKTRSPSQQPGKEPGRKEAGFLPPPQFSAGAQAHIKGLLGEGDHSGVVFKAKPGPGKSQVSPQDVIATYRRQAEAELNTERVPDALKETIKNYFLSLGAHEAKR